MLVYYNANVSVIQNILLFRCPLFRSYLLFSFGLNPKLRKQISDIFWKIWSKLLRVHSFDYVSLLAFKKRPNFLLFDNNKRASLFNKSFIFVVPLKQNTNGTAYCELCRISHLNFYPFWGQKKICLTIKRQKINGQTFAITFHFRFFF